MIHGDSDAQVSVDQSKLMDRALTKAGKTHEFILIPGADHEMSREADRTTMLNAIEKFLSANIWCVSRGSDPQFLRTHGRSTTRTGETADAGTSGSISLRRRSRRSALCTVDLASPVLVAIVCRLTDTLSRRLAIASRSRNKYTMNVDGL